nr:cell division ATP-binding protein FtsE [Pseudomarimonas arenosa]
MQFDRVSRRFVSGQQALLDVSFQLASADFSFITGHSGAGKTTLLRLVYAADRASSGSVLFEGRNLGRLRRGALPTHRRRVGVVFQDHRLLMDRSVYDNVALPLLIAGVKPSEIGKRVRITLERLGLGDRLQARPGLLSTGEQQRVGIARAIVGQPPLLVADEPTGNLDPQLAEEVMGLLAELPAQGTAVMVASHDLPLIKRMRKRVLVLDKGRLIDDFRPEPESELEDGQEDPA